MSGANRKASRAFEKKLHNDVVDMTKKRDDECVPVAMILFKKLGEMADTLRMGNAWTQEQLNEYYQKAFMDILAGLLVEKNLKVTEIDYVFQLMIQVISFFQDQTTKTIAYRVDQANAKKWGVKDIDDLRVIHITSTLADLPIPENADEAGYPQAKKEIK